MNTSSTGMNLNLTMSANATAPMTLPTAFPDELVSFLGRHCSLRWGQAHFVTDDIASFFPFLATCVTVTSVLVMLKHTYKAASIPLTTLAHLLLLAINCMTMAEAVTGDPRLEDELSILRCLLLIVFAAGVARYSYWYHGYYVFSYLAASGVVLTCIAGLSEDPTNHFHTWVHDVAQLLPPLVMHVTVTAYARLTCYGRVCPCRRGRPMSRNTAPILFSVTRLSNFCTFLMPIGLTLWAVDRFSCSALSSKFQLSTLYILIDYYVLAVSLVHSDALAGCALVSPMAYDQESQPTAANGYATDESADTDCSFEALQPVAEFYGCDCLQLWPFIQTKYVSSAPAGLSSAMLSDAMSLSDRGTGQDERMLPISQVEVEMSSLALADDSNGL